MFAVEGVVYRGWVARAPAKYKNFLATVYRTPDPEHVVLLHEDENVTWLRGHDHRFDRCEALLASTALVK